MSVRQCSTYCILLLLALSPLCPRAGEAGDAGKAKAAVAEITTKLEKPVTVELLDMSVTRALDILGKRADVNMLLVGREDRPAYQIRLNMSLDGARAVDILNLICEIAGLNYEVQPGVVRISSVLDMRERKVTFAAYSVNDLTAFVPDFPPPSMSLSTEFSSPEEPAPKFAKSPSVGPTLTNVADMIRHRIQPDSWDPNLGTSIEERGGALVVMQTDEVHALIRRLLASFRARQSRQVGLEVRAFSMKSIDADRIRREIVLRRGTLPFFDDAAISAVEKLAQDGTAQQAFSGSTIIYNTQRGLLQDVSGHTMLCKYDASGATLDPFSATVNTGTVISAMPILSDDGSLATLSLSVTHSELLGAPEVFVVQRGGLVVSQTTAASNLVTVKRRTEKKEGQGGQQPVKKEDDVTSDYEIESRNTGGALPTVGPLQVQLPALARSRISQDLVVPSGKTAAVSAPLSGRDGLVLGRELLLLVRCRSLMAPEPVLEPEKKDILEMSANLKQALEKRVSLSLLETPFERAIDAFSRQARIPMALDAKGLESHLRAPVTLDLKDVPAGEVLPLILRAGRAATVPYTSLLWVTSQTQVSARRMTLRIFDLLDITKTCADYPGEDTRISFGAAALGGANPFEMPPDLTFNLQSTDFAKLIKNKIMADAFADPATSVEESGNKLVVVNTPEVMPRIEAFLAQVRKTARRPILITTRWAVVNSDALQAAIGVDMPQTLDANVSGKILDLIAQNTSKDLASARLICFNGQNVSAFGGTERAIVPDYDVSGDVYCPNVKVIRGGFVVDVHPRMMEGTGGPDSSTQLRIDTRLDFSRTDPAIASFDPLAPAKGNEPSSALTYPPAPGKVHIPANDSQQIRCTVRIADGGAALFRLPVPPWVEGENAEAARKGQRTAIVLLQAEQQKD